jgi:hypothetical protein
MASKYLKKRVQRGKNVSDTFYLHMYIYVHSYKAHKDAAYIPVISSFLFSDGKTMCNGWQKNATLLWNYLAVSAVATRKTTFPTTTLYD